MVAERGFFTGINGLQLSCEVPRARQRPPPVRSPESVYDTLRGTNELYNSMASLARLPQISLPLAQVDGVPIGLGLAAAHGNDELLLDLAVEIGA